MDTPYDGNEKLVLCLDVGTSAACIIHLQPGVLPKVRVVSRWPGDKNNSKIPSIIYYSSAGVARAFGAEALDETTQARAESEKWEKCAYFKLWLHTSEMRAAEAYQPEPQEAESASSIRETLGKISISKAGRGLMSGIRDARSLGRGGGRGFELAPLPDNVTVEKVYRDWMGYLYRSSKDWWGETNPDGGVIWEKLEREMVFCLAHPNGWNMSEQGILRTALAQAVHKPELDGGAGADRVVFVTEGEASVHFGLHYTSAANLDSWLSVGAQIAVLDAGGSTVDTSVYRVDQATPKLKLREVKPPACVQAGAIFPTRDARTLIEAKLKKSKYEAPEYLDEILKQFDTKTKCNFVNGNDPDHMIKFGFDRDNDKSCSISRGRLCLTAAEVGKAFKPSMDLLMESVAEQLEGTAVNTILLSGGFGESPHLQQLLRKEYERKGIRIFTSDEPSKKAVAEGAALFYVRDAVVARAARFTVGTEIACLVEEWPAELLNVAEDNDYQSYVDMDGEEYQFGGWRTLLKKGDIIESDAVVADDLFVNSQSGTSHKADIFIREDDSLQVDDFMIDKFGRRRPEFKHICVVRADLSSLCTEANKHRVLDIDDKGAPEYYHHLEYQIRLMFGGTSLKAMIAWEENGVEKTGPATVIPTKYY